MSRLSKPPQVSNSAKQITTSHSSSSLKIPKRNMHFKSKLCEFLRKIFGKAVRGQKGQPKQVAVSIVQASSTTLPTPTTPKAVNAGPFAPTETLPAPPTAAPDAADDWLSATRKGPCRRPLEMSEDAKDEEWFGAIRHIDDHGLREILRHALSATHGDKCWVVEKLEGSYNRIHIMQFSDGAKYVIRVPAWGVPEKWTKEDAVAIRLQALTMNYIRRNTKLPVPQVIAYNSTCENFLGHPFIITTFLPGQSAYTAWHNDGKYSPELEQKRLHILRSLAQTMTELQHLSFDAAGSLYFEHDLDDNPKVGPLYVMDEVDFWTRNTSFEPSYNDTYQHLRSRLSKWWKDAMPSTSVPKKSHAGMFKILQLAIDCVPFHEPLFQEEDDNGSGEESDMTEEDAESPHEGKRDVDASSSADPDSEAEEETIPETFVLAPPDFDRQNILLDDDGNVTGILDWDQVCTVPRFSGWAATPLWLFHDYCSSYQWEGDVGNSDLDLQRYRNAYADYMEEAMGGKGDCIFTRKSHLFQSLQYALEAENKMSGWFVMNVCRSIIPRSDYEIYLIRIGDKEKGYKEGEMLWWRKRLREYLECKLGSDDRFCF